MPENAAAKARRLLVEGRVRVVQSSEDDGYLMAEVRGDSARIYVVNYDEDRWCCNCPTLGACSHIKALQLITITRPRS
jgi:hypothetical protein